MARRTIAARRVALVPEWPSAPGNATPSAAAIARHAPVPPAPAPPLGQPNHRIIAPRPQAVAPMWTAAVLCRFRKGEARAAVGEPHPRVLPAAWNCEAASDRSETRMMIEPARTPRAGRRPGAGQKRDWLGGCSARSAWSAGRRSHFKGRITLRLRRPANLAGCAPRPSPLRASAGPRSCAAGRKMPAASRRTPQGSHCSPGPLRR